MDWSLGYAKTLKRLALNFFPYINFEHIDREIVITKLNHPEHEKLKPRWMNQARA